MTPARGARRPAGAGEPAGGGPGGRVQAWIELRTDDPEAVSALEVARARLEAGRRLSGIRRLRLFELGGALPARAEIEDLLHRSTWFYNPHKERCRVRAAPEEATPAVAGEQAVLVVDRGAERCAAAERWWLHETGRSIEVRAGLVWLLRFEAGEDAGARAAELAVVSGRRDGLLANPNAQDCSLAGAEDIPLPWMGGAASPPPAGAKRKRGGT